MILCANEANAASGSVTICFELLMMTRNNILGWRVHNASKALANLFILFQILFYRRFLLPCFLATASYEMAADPLALYARGSDDITSIVAHHLMVLAWAIAMLASNSPRNMVIAVIAANRVLMYGMAAIRSRHSGLVKTRAFLSMFQFVVAAVDGLVMLSVQSAPCMSSHFLRTAMHASQFVLMTGLAMVHLRMASRRYGIVIVDTLKENDESLPTLIPLWVP